MKQNKGRQKRRFRRVRLVSLPEMSARRREDVVEKMAEKEGLKQR